MIALEGITKQTFLKQKMAALKKPPEIEKQHPLPCVLGRIGSLEVRLATTRAELREAQRLRYKIFYGEMSAKDKIVSLTKGRDVDTFDAHCDHLIVIDNAADKTGFAKGRGRIIGTYRLLRQEVAEQKNGFYSSAEYDLQNLLKTHKERRFLELGRSCVMKEYRSKRTVELLWHGIWAYVLHHKIDVMFGCASLEGTDITALREQLFLLSTLQKTPKQWRAKAHKNRYVAMDQPVDGFTKKHALSTLPPLIKGYLRLGAYIGDGAVIDEDFGTTDVLIILPIENINPRYVSHYGETAGRFAA